MLDSKYYSHFCDFFFIILIEEGTIRNMEKT